MSLQRLLLDRQKLVDCNRSFVSTRDITVPGQLTD